MSILIKGMRRPKRCNECRFLEGSTDDGLCHAANMWLDDDRFAWYVYDEGDMDDSKPLNCPLIELPPHGRLIDADKLFAKIPEGDIEHDVKISRTGAIADVCTWVLTAPTIIEAEEGEI